MTFSKKKQNKLIELDKEYIRSDVEERKDRLDRQISNVELKQQEIQNYITTLNHGIQQLEQLVQYEMNKGQGNINNKSISIWREQINRSVELVAKLYDTYRSFEDVKFKYHKEINGLGNDAYKLAVEIKRLDDKLGSMDARGFVEMLQELTGQFNQAQKGEAVPPKALQEANKDLASNDEYEL